MKPENDQELDATTGATASLDWATRVYNQTQNAYRNLNLQNMDWEQYVKTKKGYYNTLKNLGPYIASRLIDKYKGTNYDLINTWAPGGGFYITDSTPEWIREQLVKNHAREYDSGIKDWFKSYLTSPGFQQVLANQKAYLDKTPKYNIKPEYVDNKKIIYTNEGPEWSLGRPYQGIAFVKSYFDGSGDKDLPIPFVEAHEFAHLFPSINDMQGAIVKENTNTEEGHNSKTSEKHADVWGLKYLLYKEGIHDVRTGTPTTKEHIKKLRLKYPELRPLKQMDDEKAAWMLNHVAQATPMNNNPYKKV